MNGKKSRLEYIDALRGVAIIGVMVYHYLPRFELTYQLDFAMITQYTEYGKYGVHLFFIISGYVIYMTVARTSSPMQFIFARFSRLYPAFWVSVTLSYSLIVLYGDPVVRVLPDMYVYQANLTMLQRFILYPSIDGVYWTLTFELVFYFYMGVFMLFGLQRNSFRYSFVWLVCTIGVTCLAIVTDTELSERLKGLFILELKFPNY
ncbi:hypothetical protein BMR04_16105 [Methylococcaceae bacterium HT3]|nr:hypothetical protein BMR04_16105 [Methylococcaceae bacterium HT3]